MGRVATTRPRPSRAGLLLALALTVLAAPLAAQTPAFKPADETPEQYPAGPGRDEAFYACTACHGFKLVAAQGMSRRQWEESLAWMTQRHGMVPLEGKDLESVLAYLETTFPPKQQPRGGFQNPFLNR